MTAYFDDLPNEVLVRIILFFADNKPDLRQFQLVNKRWKFIVEMHLYRDLTLFGYYNQGNLSSTYLQFLLNPQRCKLVKNLYLSDRGFMAFDESFFAIFPNIQRVCSKSNIKLDWKLFNMRFTPDRYELKELPNPSRNFCDSMEYYDALKNHHQTLETLDIVMIDISVMDHLSSVDYILPNLKLFKVPSSCRNVKVLDDTINKCPRLEELDINSTSTYGFRQHLPDKAQIVQHQQVMRKISGHDSCKAFPRMCAYLTAKFPNVNEWHLESISIRQVDIPEPFKRMAGAFCQIMKSKKVYLRFTVNNASVPAAIRFFFLSCKVQRSVSIKYDLYNDDKHEYEDEDEDEDEESDNSDDDYPCLGGYRRKYFCRRSLIEEEDWNIASLCVTSNSALKTWTTPKITVRYMPDDLYHLHLIEKVGRRIGALNVDLRPDSKHAVKTPSENVKQMREGGALAHLIDNCPSLVCLTYNATDLNTLCPENEIKVNKALKSMEIVCPIKEELLLNLSYRAPNIERLSIAGGSNNSDMDNSRIEINMPYNSFEWLRLDYVIYPLVYTSPSFLVLEPAYYLIQVISSTHLKPTAWYCFKVGEVGSQEKLRRIRRQEYMSHVYSEKQIREIVITCKSIKRLGLPEIRSTTDGRKLNKLFKLF